MVAEQQPLYTGQSSLATPQAYYPDTNQTYQQPQYYPSSQNYVVSPNTVQTNPTHSDDESNTAMMLFILGFFIGIVWIVNYAMHRNSASEQARKFAKFSLIAFIVSLVFGLVIFFFAFLIPIIIVVGSGGGGHP